MAGLSHQQLIEVTRKFGSPVYVYDADTIRTQYQKLSAAFSGFNHRIFYACKALTNVSILKLIQQEGAGLDCVSIHEVNLGLLSGFAKENILYTPNCVDMEEIVEATKLGVNINIDNISILEQFGLKFGNSYPVCIRVNPHIMAGGNFKISTGHVDSKFGISIHQLRHIERIVKTTNLKVTGIHMHTGSEIKDVNVFLMGLNVMFDLVGHFKDVQYIDLGSGFKVPYQPGEPETNVEELGAKLAEELHKFEQESGRKLEIWFEPGKYIVSQAGYLVVKANVIKQTPATVFVGVNSGFNHLIRPMMYEAYHHIENISNPNGIERIYTVVGNICETDTFAWDRSLPEVREGDYLAFYNAGAYGFEMSSNFNSRLKPAELLIENGELRMIRKADVFEDLLRNQLWR